MMVPRLGKLTLAAGLVAALAGCQADQPFAFLKSKPAGAAQPAAAKAAPDQPAPESSVKLVDRDIEAADIYHADEKALWDGRPSLGGVWVAAPNVTDPQRVIIRNKKNGKFVIGALFRREVMNPGPKLQLSSDAAEALGMLAGQPAVIDVTALKRVEAPAKPDASKPALDSNEAIQTKSIAGIKADAKAAIDKAGAGAKTSSTRPMPRPAPANPTMSEATARTAASGKPLRAAPKPETGHVYAQLGIFSVEDNAKRAVRMLKSKGIPAAVSKEESHGKTYTSVLAGPVGEATRDGLLRKVKALGFKDAYLISK